MVENHVFLGQLIKYIKCHVWFNSTENFLVPYVSDEAAERYTLSWVGLLKVGHTNFIESILLIYTIQ